VTTRTLIIHGDADRLIDLSGSHALAQALPHATLRIFARMGHELPRPLWPELVQAMCDLVAHSSSHWARAERPRPLPRPRPGLARQAHRPQPQGPQRPAPARSPRLGYDVIITLREDAA
jgi:hypothetical protein